MQVVKGDSLIVQCLSVCVYLRMMVELRRTML